MLKAEKMSGVDDGVALVVDEGVGVSMGVSDGLGVGVTVGMGVTVCDEVAVGGRLGDGFVDEGDGSGTGALHAAIMKARTMIDKYDRRRPTIDRRM